MATLPNSLESYKAGLFIDLEINKRWSLNLGLSSNFFAATTGPQILIRNELRTSDSLKWSDSYSPSFNTAELSLSLRYKVLPFLAPTAGLTVARMYHFDRLPRIYLDENDFDPLVQDQVRRQNYRNDFLYGIEDSYERTIVMSSLGIVLSHRRVLVQVLYDLNITPVSENLRVQGESHYFQQNMDRWSVLGGFRIFN